jgi:hypothetical protein
VIASEPDDFSSNRHHALTSSWIIFSGNRCPLFGIMLYPVRKTRLRMNETCAGDAAANDK